MVSRRASRRCRLDSGRRRRCSTVSGASLGGSPGFRGYCPPKTDAPHHYVYTVFATDLAPDALAAGLDRDAFTAALRGHVLAGQSVVVRYGQAPSRRVKPSALHSSEPTPLWTKKRPVGS